MRHHPMLCSVCALLPGIVALPATADTTVPPTVDSFQTFVRDLASKRGQAVLDWWAADLDRDGIDERIAVLCDADLLFGDFVVENTRGRRWDLRFRRPVAGPPACGLLYRPAEPLPPPFVHRPDTTLDISENFNHHATDDGKDPTHKWGFAIRGGELVLVREETWRGWSTNWDLKVRWFPVPIYPRPPRGELGNPPHEIIPVAALRDL
jgi:hypothetical protein